MNIKQKSIAFYTIVRREWIRMFRIWVGTLLSPVITAILYFVIFGSVIGSRIGDMDGFSYLQFIAPGLIMMAVITNSYACTVSCFFSLKFNRDIEEMLVSPMPFWIMLIGIMTAGVMRGLIVGACVSAVALIFTHLALHSLAVVIVVAILTAVIFSIAGIFNAIFAKTFDHITIIPTFVLAPLTYLGGVFYSLALLPKGWRDVALINPIVYIIQAFRYGILGTDSVALVSSFIVMCIIAVAMFLVALWFLKRGIGIRS